MVSIGTFVSRPLSTARILELSPRTAAGSATTKAAAGTHLIGTAEWLVLFHDIRTELSAALALPTFLTQRMVSAGRPP